MSTSDLLSAGPAGDLAHFGPSATVTVGTTGRALVIASALFRGSADGSGRAGAQFFIFLDGADYFPSVFTDAQLTGGAAGVTDFPLSLTYAFQGLTAGSHTLTMKYQLINGTGFFVSNRALLAVPY